VEFGQLFQGQKHLIVGQFVFEPILCGKALSKKEGLIEIGKSFLIASKASTTGILQVSLVILSSH
jgi:hypothetical protein